MRFLVVCANLVAGFIIEVMRAIVVARWIKTLSLLSQRKPKPNLRYRTSSFASKHLAKWRTRNYTTLHLWNRIASASFIITKCISATILSPVSVLILTKHTLVNSLTILYCSTAYRRRISDGILSVIRKILGVILVSRIQSGTSMTTSMA